ncbi:uncharacterized protein AB675_1566 [Cyphellophora attinorum]|uniref:Rhodopsin domain-containing protein n=1 Tax=Cyphellophora attinorum TaxID=1664694 RepID=A0A0N0NJT3_9EURO|nr:uncharacterized protein AB675_1566 [Phialophora attinorum]KPI37258.1 hypothetical protein AB675_1566 [Phialophora attinorum]
MVDTLHPPYSVIATWPKPNYIDPHTRGPALANLCIALIVIGVLVVTARLYTRLFLTRAAGLDDACIVIALAFGIALSVLVIIGNKVWWSGHHIWDIPISKFADHRFNIWCAEWCYVISTSCTKISVLLFYRRISIKFSKAFIIATWAGIVYNILYMIAFALVLLLLCSPISAYWNSFNVIWVMTHPNFKCGAENIELPLSGVFSVIGDFYSALLPILVIFNLNLSRRQKWSLYALFSLAFLIVAAGIARTVLMWQMMNEIYDFTWVLWEMWIWGVVELYVAILAASAPALKPFLRIFLVNPLKSFAAATTSRREKRGFRSEKSRQNPDGSKAQIYASKKGSLYQSQKGSTKSRVSVRESALMEDLEELGIAHGGRDMLASWDEYIGKEIDNDELDTKRYQLQQNKHGKVAMAQVWHSSSRASSRPTTARSVTDHPQGFWNSSNTPDAASDVYVGHGGWDMGAELLVASVIVYAAGYADEVEVVCGFESYFGEVEEEFRCGGIELDAIVLSALVGNENVERMRALIGGC